MAVGATVGAGAAGGTGVGTVVAVGATVGAGAAVGVLWLSPQATRTATAKGTIRILNAPLRVRVDFQSMSYLRAETMLNRTMLRLYHTTDPARLE